MLNLTGIEYRPELAEGYRWIFDLSETAGCVDIKVYKSNNGAYVYKASVEILCDDTAESIRGKVLNVTKSIANMTRPWNPTYATMVLEVLRSLVPPKDAVVKTTDEPLDPRIAAYLGRRK